MISRSPRERLIHLPESGARVLYKFMADQIFVSPNGADWKIKVVGNQKASAICDTKAQAVERAREIAQNQHLELFVQNLDGTIAWRNSYGNDPRKSKG